MNSKWKLIFSSIILAAITQVVLLQPAAMLQTSNYESYVNSRLKFKLEYPSDWKIFELDAPALSNLKGFVSFEPLKSEQELQAGIVEETPVISIIAEQLKFKNITINEFARLQSDNIRYLFSDFDFKLENKTAITIGNNTAVKIVYTFVDPYSHDDLKIRNGMEIWTIRADTVYTISYLGEKDQYFNHLSAVQKIIDSFEIIDQTDRQAKSRIIPPIMI
jgi:hypothetical protein